MILKKGKKKLFNQRTALYVIVQSVPVSIEVFVPFSSFAGNLRLFKKVHLKAAKHIKVCRLPLVFVKIFFKERKKKEKKKKKNSATPSTLHATWAQTLKSRMWKWTQWVCRGLGAPDTCTNGSLNKPRRLNYPSKKRAVINPPWKKRLTVVK